MKKILSLLFIISILLTSIPLTSAVYAKDTVVYVSPSGSDGYAGTKNAPFATFNAAFKALDNGGTVVVTGKLDSAKTVLNASVTALCKNTAPIIITGKDPYDDKIYENASVPLNSPRLYGELKLEYVNIIPTRNYAFFNTYGNRLIFGEGVTHSDYSLYVHGGSYGNTTVSSSYIEVNSGSVGTVYMGGAFAVSTSNGIFGNTELVINGGSVTNLYIGFDKSGNGISPATIDGNVIIRHNGGIINKIEGRLLNNDTVNGYIAILTKGGLSANMELPDARDGVYIVTVGDNGSVKETEKAGIFEIIPNEDYNAYVDGRRVPSGMVTLHDGESTVRFFRDTLPTDCENALMDGKTQTRFMPEEYATRKDALIASSRAADLITDDINQIYSFLSERSAIPESWGGKTDGNITRGELIYILVTTFDSPSHSKKLFNFSDVRSEHIYYEEITKAAMAGKISGRAGDSFFPDEYITRAQMAHILSDFFSRKAKEGSKTQFSDVEDADVSAVISVSCDRESGKWDFASTEYILPESTSTEDYVKALYEQSSVLSPDAISRASDSIALAVRKNILSTPNTRDIYDFGQLGIEKIYYVSEKNGSDLNDGLSEKTPFKTPAMLRGRIQKNKNVAVLFERGGVYRTGEGTSPLYLGGSENIVLGSYGEGAKPIIMQSRKNYKYANWVEVMPNVYRLEEKLRNVGIIAFDHDITDYSDGTFEESVGEIENIDTQGFTGISDLDTDLQFYCEMEAISNTSVYEEDIDGVHVKTTVSIDTYNRNTDGYLYLYSDKGNPSERFSSIEIGECYDLVDGAAHGCIIDNLSFKFTGAHAIGLATSEDLTVKNCVFSWLGGSVLWETEKTVTKVEKSDGTKSVTETFKEATGYGNAVEIFGGCDGFYVCDNWIYQIFDDGITNQYHNLDDCIQKDMRYLGNLLEYVYHDFSNCNFSESIIYEDDFPTEGDGAYTDYTADLVVAYNICRMAGYGWGGPVKNRVNNGQMYRSAGLGANKDMHVDYNIFDSSGGYLIYTSPNANETYDKNIYIQTDGTRLIGRMQVGNFPYTENAYNDIVYHVNDTNAVAVIVDKDRIKNCRKVADGGLSFEGVQIRTDGKMALRFIFSAEKSELARLLVPSPDSYTDTDMGFGCAVMPARLLEEGALQKNSINVTDDTVKRAKTVPAVKLFFEDDKRLYFTVCITDITKERYGEEFAAVPYITYDENGATVTVYGKSKSSSLYDVAKLVYNDENADEAQKEYVYNNIISVYDSEK